MRLPLEDVTVLDLSHALAGPFCSTMLGRFRRPRDQLEPKGARRHRAAWGTPCPAARPRIS